MDRFARLRHQEVVLTENAPRQINLGEFQYWYRAANNMPDAVRQVYLEIEKKLPAVEKLSDYQPSVASQVFAADGSPIGEFYFENLPQGRHEASVVHDGRTCTLRIEVPRSDEPTMIEPLPEVA